MRGSWSTFKHCFLFRNVSWCIEGKGMKGYGRKKSQVKKWLLQREGQLCWDLVTWGFYILPERFCIGCLCWSLYIWSWLIDGQRLMLWRLLSRAGKPGSAHTVSLPLENPGKTAPGSTHQRTISLFLFLFLPLMFSYVHLVMFISLYCYLGQTNCISSQMSYFRAIHCFPEI